MKIVLINNLYAPWVRGGAERIVEKSVAGFEKNGHDVFVIATAPKESLTPNAYYLQSIFYNLEKYPLWQRFFWHLYQFFSLINYFKIKKILQWQEPDLVITHNLLGIGFFTPCLIKSLKIKHFHTLHDMQLLHPSGLMFFGKEKILNTLPAKIYQWLIKFYFGSPSLIISPSAWLLSEYEKRGYFPKSTKKIIPNYFLVAEIKNTKYKIQNTKYQFLYVGLVEEHKGVKFLINSFLELLVENKNFQAELSLVGSGSQLEEIKLLAANYPAIKILGRKSHEQIEDLMAEADCLIVPSLCYENSPTVIYEAEENGLPVLAAKIGGIPELVEAAGGCLFEPGDKADLQEKMLQISGLSDSVKKASFEFGDYIVELEKLLEKP